MSKHLTSIPVSKEVSELTMKLVQYEDAWRQAEFEHDYALASKCATAVNNIQDALLEIAYENVEVNYTKFRVYTPKTRD